MKEENNDKTQIKSIESLLNQHQKIYGEYDQHLDSTFSKYISGVDQQKTVKELISSRKLGEAVDGLLSTYLNISEIDGKLAREYLGPDLSITDEELKQNFRGRESKIYDLDVAVELKEMIRKKLEGKLMSIVQSKSMNMKDVDKLKGFVEKIYDDAGIKDRFPDLSNAIYDARTGTEMLGQGIYQKLQKDRYTRGFAQPKNNSSYSNAV